MKELPSAAISEKASFKSVGEARQEGHLQEAKHAEAYSAISEANSRMTEYIDNGLPPEKIAERLASDLRQPEVQRRLINEFSPYSENINSHIRTTEELFTYEQNGLQESTILGRPCLQIKIDPERQDAMGCSNKERMEAGRPPRDENGDPVNLHHIGQKEDSPLAELPDRLHKEFDGVLHDKSIATEVHGESKSWNYARSQYWQERANTL